MSVKDFDNSRLSSLCNTYLFSNNTHILCSYSLPFFSNSLYISDTSTNHYSVITPCIEVPESTLAQSFNVSNYQFIRTYTNVPVSTQSFRVGNFQLNLIRYCTTRNHTLSNTFSIINHILSYYNKPLSVTNTYICNLYNYRSSFINNNCVSNISYTSNQGPNVLTHHTSSLSDSVSNSYINQFFYVGNSVINSHINQYFYIGNSVLNPYINQSSYLGNFVLHSYSNHLSYTDNHIYNSFYNHTSPLGSNQLSLSSSVGCYSDYNHTSSSNSQISYNNRVSSIVNSISDCQNSHSSSTTCFNQHNSSRRQSSCSSLQNNKTNKLYYNTPTSSIDYQDHDSRKTSNESSSTRKNKNQKDNKERVIHKSIAILYLNIRSLNKNFDKLHNLLVNMISKPDIIALSETWITEKRFDKYNLPGFYFLHTKSPSNSGGVAFFISNQYNAEIIHDYDLNVKDCEDLWIEVDMSPKRPLVIGTIYRHPRYSFDLFEDSLITSINKLNRKNKNYVFGGDINIDLLLEDDRIRDYKNNYSSIGCNQHINSFTRLPSNTLLDHIYSNFESTELQTEILTEDITDHLPILAVLPYQKKHTNKQQHYHIRDMRNFNKQHFLDELDFELKSFFTSTPMDTPIDTLWENFEAIFNKAISNHAPLRKLTKKEIKLQEKPWITKAIQTSIRFKNIMFKIAIKSGHLPTYYKKYRNLLTRVIDQSKRHYYGNQIRKNKGNSKKLWSTINNIISNKKRQEKQIQKLLKSDGDETLDPYEICNELNTTFVQMADKLMESNQRSSKPKKTKIDHITSSNKSFFLKPMTENDMKKMISNLNSAKSTRSDTPAIKFIKIGQEVIVPYVVYIFNKCITEGHFPTSLKIAEVVPIFKSGGKTISTNYRPISLLSAFSKLFEQYMATQLMHFFNKHQTLHNLQYGFRQGSSTELAVANICEDLSNAIDGGSINCTAFIDLAKAFNTVNHDILCKKLDKYGIRGEPLRLIESYLASRWQYTTTNNVKSALMEINVGVPQGSSLGPLLFLVYINDLPLYTSLKVRLFADDACLSYENENPQIIEEVVNRELGKVNEWLLDNKLFLNFSKSTYLIFTNKRLQHNFSIKLNHIEIKQSNYTKYLGITIDNKLTWQQHIMNLKSKLARNNYTLYKLSRYVNENTLRTVYFSLIHPFLQYCISAWGGAAESHILLLERLQKQAIRNICRQPPLTHTDPLFLSQKILKLTDIHEFQVGKLIYDRLANNPIGENNLIKIQDIHSYNTRASSNDNLYHQYVRTNKGIGSLKHQGPKIWMKIPTEIKKSDTIFHFKSKFKQHLLNKYV